MNKDRQEEQRLKFMELIETWAQGKTGYGAPWRYVESLKAEWQREASNMVCTECGADLLCKKCEDRNFNYYKNNNERQG